MLALRNTTNFWGGDRSLLGPDESEHDYVDVGNVEEADDVWEEEENNEEEERLPELNDADDDDYEYEYGRMSGGGGKRKGHVKEKSGGLGIYSSRHVRGQIQRLANATKAVVSTPKGKKSEGKRLLR
jgi:hypothetical protein